MLGAELALLLILQQPVPTVTLVFTDRQVTVTEAEAWELLKSEDQAVKVAATLALGTRPTIPPSVAHLTPGSLFRERFQRQPAQAPVPDN